MQPQRNKRLILASLAAMARHLGRPPSRREFLAQSPVSETAIFKHFPSWNATLAAAGLPPYTRNRRRDDREFLEDWGRVVRQARKIPSRSLYCRLGQFDHRTLARRFGAWSKLPAAFCQFARRKRPWADVLALLPARAIDLAPQLSGPLDQGAPCSPDVGAPPALLPSHHQVPPPVAQAFRPVRFSSPPSSLRHRPLPNRPIYGQPMDFRGLRHEPVNEQGVVLLFGMVAKDLGYIVESVQSGFPDCEAKRQIAPQRWQRVHLEFEYESRNYRDHGHPLSGCDVIVCWHHNWPTHPPHLEILELSSLLPALPAGH